MNLFKKLFEWTTEMINELRKPFIEKSLKRWIESARDNALQKINDLQMEKFELLKNWIKEGSIKSATVAEIIQKEVEQKEHQLIIDACDSITEELFWKEKAE